MQHLGAVGGDLLRLVIVQRLEQPRGRHVARVGGEHPRHVGPDLEPGRGEPGRDVGRRGVRATAAEQHRAAVFVRCDEALRQHRAAERGEPRGRLRVGLEAAGSREQRLAFRHAAPIVGPEQLARIDPRRGDPLRIQEGGTDLGRHQLTGRHHAGPDPVADLAHQCNAAGQILEVDEVPLDAGRHRQAELGTQVRVTLAQLRQDGDVPALERAGQQRLERVGDLGQGRVNDHRGLARVQTAPDDRGDVLPVGE